VRQVAGELGKDVEFIVGNAEGEMDRNVLERMARRWSICCATPSTMAWSPAMRGCWPASRSRAASPDPRRRRHRLRHARRRRRRAAGRGAAQGDQARPARPPEMSDREVLQFILQPGFSTAEKITQISGRGVGMDVVHEEVRQLAAR
jgi:chemosensory pili system protein ChpA (sensor histidine kinase/response regulator)